MSILINLLPLNFQAISDVLHFKFKLYSVPDDIYGVQNQDTGTVIWNSKNIFVNCFHNQDLFMVCRFRIIGICAIYIKKSKSIFHFYITKKSPKVISLKMFMKKCIYNYILSKKYQIIHFGLQIFSIGFLP